MIDSEKTETEDQEKAFEKKKNAVSFIKGTASREVNEIENASSECISKKGISSQGWRIIISLIIIAD